MHCRIVWPEATVIDLFKAHKTFVKQTLPKHSLATLVRREEAYMPDDVAQATRERTGEQFEEAKQEALAVTRRIASRLVTGPTTLDNTPIKALLAPLKAALAAYVTAQRAHVAAFAHTTTAPETDAADPSPVETGAAAMGRRVVRCQHPACDGILAATWDCLQCHKHTCAKCEQPVLTEPHVCNPDHLATAQRIRSECRACPQCHVPIFRSEGCTQMFCTQCHVAFDWRTGRVFADQRRIHNPHFFEWQQQQQQQQPATANAAAAPGHTACELAAVAWPELADALDRAFMVEWRARGVPGRRATRLDTLLRELAVRVTGAQDQAYTVTADTYRTLRIERLKGKITDEQWRRKLALREGNRRVARDALLVLEALMDSCRAVAVRMLTHTLALLAALDEFEALIQLANDGWKQIAAGWGRKSTTYYLALNDRNDRWIVHENKCPDTVDANTRNLTAEREQREIQHAEALARREAHRAGALQALQQARADMRTAVERAENTLAASRALPNRP